MKVLEFEILREQRDALLRKLGKKLPDGLGLGSGLIDASGFRFEDSHDSAYLG